VRRVALRLLQSVLWQNRPLEQALDKGLAMLARRDDRALARAIASETLRWLVDLDRLIDSAMKKPLPQDARARMVLRLALAQKLCLNTADHAIVSTALPLVEAGPRRLVHGVLSSMLKQNISLPDAPRLPARTHDRWTAAHGAQSVAALGAAHAKPAPLDLCLKPGVQPLKDGKRLFGGCIRLEAGQDVTALPGYEAGDWWVQDAAAQVPALLLGDVTGKSVLDLCAAPGGKTMQLAAGGAQVTAVDSSARRLEMLTANLRRTGLAADIICADALVWQPGRLFDAILLDAPCSATGTARRHPDVLHLRDGLPLDDLVVLQQRLMARAASWLKPGGRLVYAVCSMEPDEGEAMLAHVAAAVPALRADPAQGHELPACFARALRTDGAVRLHAGLTDAPGGCDGFFMARYLFASE
jgi:16S rRNA (cytosine967-C5)-methyltransferase